MTITLTVTGKPIAKARPKFVRRGKFVSAYNPQETEEGRWLWQVIQQYKGPPISGPVRLSLAFWMPIPKSTSKKKREQMLTGYLHHDKKPDIDNLIKFTFDCLNGVLFEDDRQVIGISAIKTYSEIPRTVVVLRKVEGDHD